MARGRRESDNVSDSSDSSSESSSSNSSSSSDESSGKSSRESTPDTKSKKISRKDRSKHGDNARSSSGRHLKEKNATEPKTKSRSPGSPPSESRKAQEDTHMARFGEGRSADELSIGAGASDDEYLDEVAQVEETTTQETSKKRKSRREGLSSGEVTPEEESGEVTGEEGDSDDSYSWRESRVRTMLQSHVQKPSEDEPRREAYDRYDSDHEGAKPFRSVVGTTITRPGQRYSDSDDGEIIDTDEEKERERRKSSRDKYSRSSPKRHSNQEERKRKTKDSSSSRRHGDRETSDKHRRKTDRDASRERKRSRRRSETKEGSSEKTEDRKERKEKKEKRSKEHKDDEQYEDAKVKFRKRVWDKKEEEWKGKRKVPDSPRPEDDEKPKEADKENDEPPAPKKKKEDNLMTRTGGAYIPPAKLAMMRAQITDKTSEAYQRMDWEALKKSINGLINKVNVPNIGMIVQELLQLNIVRGRGLLCRSIIAAQTASPTFTHVYAALVAVINTKFPQNGELLLRRLIINFKKGFRRNDKTLCLSSTRFIAHLVNQQVAHEIIALEILTLLLENVTDDSVEVAVGFVKECGLKLQEVSPRGIHAIFERMRSILHEAEIDKRVQYMVEVVFANRKDGFKEYPSVVPELDLIEESEQFTHMMTLEDNYQDENILNVFKLDPEFIENEEKYKAIKKEILDEGSDDSDSDDDESGEADSSDDSDEAQEEKKMEIIDQTETNLVALRRTIYLTIQSSLDFEECAHKMMKMDFKPGQEREVCNMVLDCCAQQRTYEKFFGLLAQRFCQLKREYVAEYQAIFPEQYSTCHRLDTNKLRNVAKLFAHLFHTDATTWTVLECVRMNEEDTTSSSRIFIKIMFLELSEFLGLPKLNDRFKDKTLQPYFEGLLPRDNPANTRFAINFFTTIGLGGLTDDLRDHLKNVQRQIMQQRQPVMPSDSSSSSSSESESSSSSSSSSSESSSDSSSESSDSDRDRKKKKKKRAAKETAKKKSASKKKEIKEKENHRAKENGRGRNKERARQEERPQQDERVNRRDRIENNMDGRGKQRGGSREMEDSRPRYNNERDRDRKEMRGRQSDARANYANHDDERDHEKHPRNNRDGRYPRNDERDLRQTRNEDREARQTRNEDGDSRRTRNEDRDARYIRNEERDVKQIPFIRNEIRDVRQSRNEDREERYTRNEERDARYTRNERDSRQTRNEEMDARQDRNDDRDARHTRNEDRDVRQTRNEDGDSRQTSVRNEERARDKQRDDKHLDRNADRQQNAKERKQQNVKRSKQQEESDSSESDSSSSEESSSSSSSSSSSESESSMDASPPRKTQGKPGRNNPNHEGRGRAQDARENFSDKENQRGNRRRTRTDSSSDGKYNEPNRDLNRHNSQNSEYNDVNRQGRDDRWDGRRNGDNQFDRGDHVRNPRTRYNSRGEDDYVNNARNKDFHRGYDRMEVDGYDRRNDRGRGRYENDKPPPPRYNERERYDGDRGSRYDRY